ncbi:MAG: HEAT repeat domain-containing protein [Nitrospirae bacterium]|nr:HEAT repeat domain-containing protein [Nitrospirota bacterium]
MTQKQIWLNLGGLIALIGLLGLFYWQSTGARAVPALTESLQHKDAKVRIAAALALAEIGSTAKAAVPVLLDQALHDPVLYAGTTAAGALKTIDLVAARQVMTAYLPALQSADVQTRRTACAMLEGLGPVAKPAVPDLTGVLNDVDETVRMHAVGALGEIGIPATLVIPALTKALHDPSQTVRHRALSQFAFSIPPTESVMPHLKELAEGKDRGIAVLAQSALNSPHRQTKNRTAVYVTMLQMGSANDYTLRQLAQFGPEAAGTVPSVIPVLQHSRPLYRYLAAEVLGAIGPGAKDAVPALIATLRDIDPVVQGSAAEALEAIGTPEAHQAVTAYRHTEGSK